MVLVDEKEVVEVAADLQGGQHGGEEVEVGPVGEGGKGVREGRELDLAGDLQVAVQGRQLLLDV